MISAIIAEDNPAGPIIHIGRDAAGHWLVQACGGQIEGRFVSRDAAWTFARSEARGITGAAVVSALHPLVPAVSFAPLSADEIAIDQAA